VEIYQSLFLKSSQRSQWLERCGIRFIWDCESSEKRKADKTPTTSDRVKRSRHGGGPCPVKPFKEQHPDSRRKIVKHLSTELRDVSSENVHAVTLAVSGYLRRELTKYCTDDSLLQHASVMMT
jgi:hypothetical protein